MEAHVVSDYLVIMRRGYPTRTRMHSMVGRILDHNPPRYYNLTGYIFYGYLK